MANLRILIADDEAPARSKMRRLLGQFDQVEVVHAAENGIDALEHIHKLRPDLVFLDIEMPGMTGLEVARSIELTPPPAVVFTTAYSEYALQAFEVNALDYLLKPFSEERVKAVLDKVRAGQSAPHDREKLATLESDEEDDASETDTRLLFANKIAIPTRDRYKLVDYTDISLMEVEDRNVRIYVGKDSYLLNYTLETFEKRLPQELFFRVNRSTIVGMEHVREIVIWFGNRFKLILDNGKEVISSRERSRLIKQVLKL